MDVLNQDVPNFGGTKADDSCESDAMDEGTVNVEKGLLQTLSVEVKEVVAMLKNNNWNKLRGTNDTMACPLCPCRQFRDMNKRGNRRRLAHALLHQSGNEVATATVKDVVASG